MVILYTFSAAVSCQSAASTGEIFRMTNMTGPSQEADGIEEKNPSGDSFCLQKYTFTDARISALFLFVNYQGIFMNMFAYHKDFANTRLLLKM